MNLQHIQRLLYTRLSCCSFAQSTSHATYIGPCMYDSSISISYAHRYIYTRAFCVCSEVTRFSKFVGSADIHIPMSYSPCVYSLKSSSVSKIYQQCVFCDLSFLNFQNSHTSKLSYILTKTSCTRWDCLLISFVWKSRYDRAIYTPDGSRSVWGWY